MTRLVRIFSLTALALFLGCVLGCKDTKEKPKEGIDINFPGGSVKIGEEGVQVEAPNVNVDVNKDKVGVKAPNVDVQVDKKSE